jgi:hypothetical protein
VTTSTTESQTEGVEEVQHLMQVLVKGMRALQLYLPNNPVYQRAVENIKAAFEPVWEYGDELDLQVSETDLVWGEAVVLAQPTKSESVAWVLFKDGVRSVTLLKGAEDDEVVRLLQVLQQARTLDPEAADDLLTLLWDQDFQSIRYEHVELGQEDIQQLKPSKEEPQPPEAVRRAVVEDVREETATQQVISIDDFDSTLYFLDEKEIDYLKSEIGREYGQDLRGNVLSMLFDLLELQTYGTVRAELISIVDHFIPYLLAVGDFPAVAYILKEVRVILERARELLPEHRQMLTELPAKLSEPEPLGQLLQSLDEATVHPSEDELGELFRELRPEALESILGWLPRLTNERVRSLLHAAARRLGQANPDQLIKALASKEEEVLVETVRLATQLKLPPLASALGGVFERGGKESRRAAVEALAGIGTPGALQQLEKVIDDRDRDVRIGAVRVVGNQGYRKALGAVRGVVTGRRIRTADLTEQTAFFETFGMLAGDDALSILVPMLLPRGLFRRKEEPQIRACAAMALGKVRTPEARKVLERALNDKDPVVRNAVNRAMEQSASR